MVRIDSLIEFSADAVAFPRGLEGAEACLAAWLLIERDRISAIEVEMISDYESVPRQADAARSYISEHARRKRSIFGGSATFIIDPRDNHMRNSFARFAYWSTQALVFTDWSGRPSFQSVDSGSWATYLIPASRTRLLGQACARYGSPEEWRGLIDVS